MRRCNTDEADLTIDNIPYKLDRLAELKALRHMDQYRGVTFPHPSRTLERLKAEHSAFLHRRREERRKLQN